MIEIPEHLHRLAYASGLSDDLDRELRSDPEKVRRDCAFCSRERSPADDNHAPDCPYWSFFGGQA